jgi:uncharacterized protein
MGTWAGINTMVANAAGPVAALYLIALDLQKMQFVGTVAWLFLVINLAKVPLSAHLGLINLPSLWLNLMLTPAVVAGLFVGRLLVGLIPQRVFETLTLWFAVVASIRLIWF